MKNLNSCSQIITHRHQNKETGFQQNWVYQNFNKSEYFNKSEHLNKSPPHTHNKPQHTKWKEPNKRNQISTFQQMREKQISNKPNQKNQTVVWEESYEKNLIISTNLPYTHQMRRTRFQINQSIHINPNENHPLNYSKKTPSGNLQRWRRKQQERAVSRESNEDEGGADRRDWSSVEREQQLRWSSEELQRR